MMYSSCRKLSYVMLRNTIYTKRKKTIHDLFFHQSTSYQQNLRILSKLYFSSSSTYSDSDYSSDKTTHFGYQTVSEKEKHENVLNVFDNVANSYNLMNDAMSIGIHRLWKDHFVSMLSLNRSTKILDVAGGTGDIAFRVLDKLKDLNKNNLDEDTFGHVTVCDINKSMLKVGQDRAQKLGYHSSHVAWVEGDAQKLPFEDNTFDAYTIAFGIRNVVDIDQALSEAYRVLKRGGRFLCLEFSHVENPVFNTIYETYSFEVIPPVGMILAGDWDSYQYLVESIRKFPKQEDFRDKIKDVGFKVVSYENLTFGVTAIHSGFKL